MQERTPTKEAIPFKDLPDWAQVTKSQISKVISLSEATLDAMIKKNIFPKGKQLLGRTLFWNVSAVREAVERLGSGEFKDVKLWENKNKKRRTSS